LACLALIQLAEPASAGPFDAPGICRTGTPPARGELERRLTSGAFRIHFTTHGPNAIADDQDRDKNGVPDRIDDLATQLNAAHQVFSKVLGLREPLKQPRYKLAISIDIYVFALNGPKGLAFDEVVNRKNASRNIEQGCALQIFIDKDVDPARNVTPAHELFHLYQYGYTPFKTSWFLEGMARWMDEVLDPKTIKQVTEVSEPSCSSYFRHTYRASTYWAQHSRHSSQRLDELTSSPTLNDWRYLDGRPVVNAQNFQDKHFALDALERLQALGDKISTELGEPPHNWPESLQRSAQFDQAICQAIEQDG